MSITFEALLVLVGADTQMAWGILDKLRHDTGMSQEEAVHMATRWNLLKEGSAPVHETDAAKEEEKPRVG